jgi:hypothetical protein
VILVLLQELNPSLHTARQIPLACKLDFVRKRIDSQNIGVTLIDQQVDEIAWAATNDENTRALVREIFEKIVFIELVKLPITLLDILGGLPEGIERLDLRRKLFAR